MAKVNAFLVLLDRQGAQEREKNEREFMFKKATMDRLKKANVKIVDELRFHLGCKACGQVWSPQSIKGYWRCPNGCNHTGTK